MTKKKISEQIYELWLNQNKYTGGEGVVGRIIRKLIFSSFVTSSQYILSKTNM